MFFICATLSSSVIWSSLHDLFVEFANVICLMAFELWCVSPTYVLRFSVQREEMWSCYVLCVLELRGSWWIHFDLLTMCSKSPSEAWGWLGEAVSRSMHVWVDFNSSRVHLCIVCPWIVSVDFIWSWSSFSLRRAHVVTTKISLLCYLDCESILWRLLWIWIALLCGGGTNLFSQCMQL